MAILQILSQKPSLYDEWFASYDILRQFYSRHRDLGGLLAPKGCNPPKLIFWEVLWYLAGFWNHTFFILKNNFFHSSLLGMTLKKA